MQRRETVRVSAINNLVQLVVLIEVLLGEAQDLNYFVPITCINLGPIVHLNFPDVLLALLHGLRLLGSLASGALHGRCAGSGLLGCARATSSRTTVGRELVSLLVVFVSTVYVVLIVARR